jgi:hypothetical protein
MKRPIAGDGQIGVQIDDFHELTTTFDRCHIPNQSGGYLNLSM